MSKLDTLQFVYHFEPIRPELLTDPDTWTEEDNRTREAHFAYLKKSHLGWDSSAGWAQLGWDWACDRHFRHRERRSSAQFHGK